ncbi:hypothetical protein [Burkholderia metallica]|uniref:hypothetical protein n=1 Tax=Burkholderia metallica TaxID=488729 RepID=UPI00157537F2|nr:hypothetical protein [Burkholderia metallica]NTZ08184.1 hypothetical protein [Burkholderia metallica]
MSLETVPLNLVDAERYGVLESILLNHVRYWVGRNREAGTNIVDYRVWTYDSAAKLANQFRCFSEQQIGRAMRKLVEFGLIMKGCFNANKYDKTAWYTLADESGFASSEAYAEWLEAQYPDESEVVPEPIKGDEPVGEPLTEENFERSYRELVDACDVDRINAENFLDARMFCGLGWDEECFVYLCEEASKDGLTIADAVAICVERTWLTYHAHC